MQPIVDDLTVCHRTTYLPTLEEVNAALARHPRVEVAFYDPGADPHAPWIWLQDERGKALRFVEALSAEDVLAVALVWRPRLQLCR